MNAKKKNSTDHSVEEMNVKLLELDREIFELRNTLALTRKLEKPHLIKQKRREKARILTALTQKQAARGIA